MAAASLTATLVPNFANFLLLVESSIGVRDASGIPPKSVWDGVGVGAVGVNMGIMVELYHLSKRSSTRC